MNRTLIAPVILTVVSVVYSMHVAHADNPTPSKSGAHLEKSIHKAAEWRIDRVAKVKWPGIFPSCSHHIPISGARA